MKLISYKRLALIILVAIITSLFVKCATTDFKAPSNTLIGKHLSP